MKTSLWLAVCGMLSMSAFAQDQQTPGDFSTEIKIGSVVGIAVGEAASTNITIGVTPPDTGANDVHLEIGDIFRAAIGEGAEVVIQLPATEETP